MAIRLSLQEYRSERRGSGSSGFGCRGPGQEQDSGEESEDEQGTARPGFLRVRRLGGGGGQGGGGGNGDAAGGGGAGRRGTGSAAGPGAVPAAAAGGATLRADIFLDIGNRSSAQNAMDLLRSQITRKWAAVQWRRRSPAWRLQADRKSEVSSQPGFKTVRRRTFVARSEFRQTAAGGLDREHG